MAIQLSDPRPAYCSACHNAQLDQRFVDFEAAFDGGMFVAAGNEYVAGSDDLHLCESCVRSACELLGFKPQLHARQSRELKRLESAAKHWQDYAVRVEAAQQDRPQAAA